MSSLVLPECVVTFICGPVASGKTFLIQELSKNDNRHVAFDSTGEYIDMPGREQIWASPKALNDRLKAKPYFFRLVYVPGRDRKGDFTHVLNCLWWLDVSKLLICDEVADICPVDSLDEDIEMLLRFARKAKLGFLAASQRIADVHKLFTGGCRMVVLFKTNEARDLDAIESRWKCADMVRSLRPLIYDDIAKKTIQVPQCVVIIKGQEPYIYDFATQEPARRVKDVSDERGLGEPDGNSEGEIESREGNAGDPEAEQTENL